jgi:hypothetical protein
MKPTMNLNDNPTVVQLTQLLHACDDEAGSHVPWVARNGHVHVTQLNPGQMPRNLEDEQSGQMCIRYEMFDSGGGWVGPEVSERDEFVQKLFQSMVREYPRARSLQDCMYIDDYMLPPMG